MSSPVWTNQRPTEAGMYWYYDASLDRPEIMTLRKTPLTIYAESQSLSFHFGDEDCIPGEDEAPEFWSFEPIEVPELPTGRE